MLGRWLTALERNHCLISQYTGSVKLHPTWVFDRKTFTVTSFLLVSQDNNNHTLVNRTLDCTRAMSPRFYTQLLKSKGCNAIPPCGYCGEDLNNLQSKKLNELRDLKASCIPCCGDRKCIHLAKHNGSKRNDQRYWKRFRFICKKIWNLSCSNFALAWLCLWYRWWVSRIRQNPVSAKATQQTLQIWTTTSKFYLSRRRYF